MPLENEGNLGSSWGDNFLQWTLSFTQQYFKGTH